MLHLYIYLYYFTPDWLYQVTFENQMFDIFLCIAEITVATVVFIPLTNGYICSQQITCM